MLAELRSLIAGRSDLWPVVIETLTDADWFSVLQDKGIWTRRDACWVTAAWCSRNLQMRGASWSPWIG